MSDDPTPPARQPIFNIPPATQALIIANVAVHLLRLLLPAGSDDALVSLLAFVPDRYTAAGGIGWPALVDPVTYQFLHANFIHLGINMLALLAFGSGVERRIGGARMLIFFLVCGVAAAAAHFAVYPSSPVPIIGASGAISGLFGGVLRFQFSGGAGGRRGLWTVVIVWLVVNVAFGQTGMPGMEDAAIAWVAHLGGFVAGLLLFGLAARRPPPDRS
ncbi:MAG TPA: rhomboid family intramembrane serine protease [Stellaceae bacterium]|nr:rhomboid family intramembrane serine protease [Stellaceae bacterium]